MTKKKGFALATTLVMLAASIIALTTMFLVLSRSLQLTSSHANSVKAFYVSESGKEYAMWKLGSHNQGDDAEQLAHCLIKDATCPTGLNVSWSFALPNGSDSSFAVSAVSGADSGTANITSRGQTEMGNVAARRRTRITAFKPTRQFELNDQVYDYAISVDEDLWTLANGALQVRTEGDEPIKAGIHANDDINQLLFGRIDVDGPVHAADVLSMPGWITTNEMIGEEFRGRSCGFVGCTSKYDDYPKYCFGTGCDGYVGAIPMPGFDINSALPDSFKTIAREYENTTGQKHIYNNSELESALETARVTGVNDGWFTTAAPITYVTGDLNVDYGHKLRVPGVLVVQGKLSVGIPRRFPIWQCIFPSTCTPSTYLEINQQDAVTGLVVTNDITFAMYIKDVNINGLIYSGRTFTAACLFDPQELTGVIVARNYHNYDALCNPLLSEPMHQQVYDTSKLHLLTQGPRSINNVTTVYSGHWEEEY